MLITLFISKQDRIVHFKKFGEFYLNLIGLNLMFIKLSVRTICDLKG